MLISEHLIWTSVKRPLMRYISSGIARWFGAFCLSIFWSVNRYAQPSNIFPYYYIILYFVVNWWSLRDSYADSLLDTTWSRIPKLYNMKRLTMSISRHRTTYHSSLSEGRGSTFLTAALYSYSTPQGEFGPWSTIRFDSSRVYVQELT